VHSTSALVHSKPMELAHSTGALPPGYQAHNVIAEAQLRDTEAAATLSVARKASRERAELEKRHYEECQVCLVRRGVSAL
jgi:hypothetical protein